jgi:hypothetical protein
MEKYFKLFSEKTQKDMQDIHKQSMILYERCLLIAKDLHGIDVKYKGLKIGDNSHYKSESENMEYCAKLNIYDCSQKIVELAKKEFPFCRSGNAITYEDFAGNSTFENMLIFTFGDNYTFSRNYIENLIRYNFLNCAVVNDIDCSVTIPINKHTESGIYHFLKLCEMRYTAAMFNYLHYIHEIDFSVIDLRREYSSLCKIDIVDNVILQPNDTVKITLKNKKLIHIFATMQFCIINQ